MWVFPLKFLLGGSVVVAFALISEAIRPHSASGIFSASPSIALAGLTIAYVTTGQAVVQREAVGMLIGAAAMLAYVCGAWFALRKTGALVGSIATLAIWVTVAAMGYALVHAGIA